MKKMIFLVTLGLGTMLLANPANQMEHRKKVESKKVDQKVQKRVEKRDVKKINMQRETKIVEKRRTPVAKRVEKKRAPVTKRAEQRRAPAAKQTRFYKQDRNLQKRHTRNRNFRDRNDFERMRNQHRLHPKHAVPRRIVAYRHYQPAWYRSYLNDRLPFYDRHGYYYGYFNEVGYFFEGLFYRYDRLYTYRDRLRGRGLFDPYYYRPYR